MTEQRVHSPVGPLFLFASGKAIAGVAFSGNRKRVLDHLQRHGFKTAPGGVPEKAALEKCRKELDSWFRDPDFKFTTPVVLAGTAFQKSIWRALQKIPAGKQETYTTLAMKMGRDARLARAVGSANSRNPLAIIVPCHRVTGAGGKLNGFSGGLAVARKLSRLEGVTT